VSYEVPRLLDITPAQYHAGPPGNVPHLSVSISKLLLDRSPLHAWYAHPKLGAGPSVGSDAKERGSIIHKLWLGKGAESAIINHTDYRTNAAKAERDAAVYAGQIPIKIADYAEIASAAETLRSRLMDLGYDLQQPGALVEQAIEWDEAGEHSPIRCKAMFDWVNVASGLILDVKSIDNACEESAQRSAFRYCYHMQSAGYCSALNALRAANGVSGSDAGMTYLFCELQPPYGGPPARMSGAFQEIGAPKWPADVRRWEECLHSGEFPGYSRDGAPVRLEPPGWALSSLTEVWA